MIHEGVIEKAFMAVAGAARVGGYRSVNNRYPYGFLPKLSIGFSFNDFISSPCLYSFPTSNRGR